MAHELERMMYAGEVPWHGLGTRVPANVGLADAIELAGLNWRVGLRPAYAAIADGTYARMPGRSATVRETDGRVLGCVSDLYRPIQNRQLFETFAAALNGADAVWHTAGSLRGGCEVWALAELPGDWRIADEEHKRFLFATAGHDGLHDARFLPTDVRVICKNTQRMALAAASKAELLTVTHRGDTDGKLAAVSDVFARALASFNGYKEKCEALAGVSLTRQQEVDLLEQILGGDGPRIKVDRERIQYLAHRGQGNAAIEGTGLALYEGTAEYVDHYKRVGAGEKRFSYTTTGAGGRLKARCLATLTRELLHVHSPTGDAGGLLESILDRAS